MGIVGLGTDLVQMGRIGRVFARFGERFLRRAYHPAEIEQFRTRHARHQARGVEYLPSRWAVKEATYKILHSHSGVRIPFPDIAALTGDSGTLSCHSVRFGYAGED